MPDLAHQLVPRFIEHRRFRPNLLAAFAQGRLLYLQLHCVAELSGRARSEQLSTNSIIIKTD
jgi:hypothetical protein